jgi:hypothetical protein
MWQSGFFYLPAYFKKHKNNICLKLNRGTTAELYFYAFANATPLQDGGAG